MAKKIKIIDDKDLKKTADKVLQEIAIKELKKNHTNKQNI